MKGFAGQLLRDAFNLIEHAPRLYFADPEFYVAFALALANL